jgi:hypothetical protein
VHATRSAQHDLPGHLRRAWAGESISRIGGNCDSGHEDQSSVFGVPGGIRSAYGQCPSHQGTISDPTGSGEFLSHDFHQGTGVVTSVPSDSPDDYATLMDLRKKAEYYKIDPAWAAYDPVPVLSTPTYGEMSAPALVKQLKIVSQKDVKQLAEAKELAYKEGFYNGTMLVGEFKGEPVQEAKNKVRASMIAQGVAFAYAEPEGLVISRSADECVVALMDQWYLDYGETKWRAEADRCVPFVSPRIFELITVFMKPTGADEHILPGDAEWIRGHPGLAESVGVRPNIWFGLSAALGPAVLS